MASAGKPKMLAMGPDLCEVGCVPVGQDGDVGQAGRALTAQREQVGGVAVVRELAAQVRRDRSERAEAGGQRHAVRPRRCDAGRVLELVVIHTPSSEPDPMLGLVFQMAAVRTPTSHAREPGGTAIDRIHQLNTEDCPIA